MDTYTGRSCSELPIPNDLGKSGLVNLVSSICSSGGRTMEARTAHMQLKASVRFNARLPGMPCACVLPALPCSAMPCPLLSPKTFFQAWFFYFFFFSFLPSKAEPVKIMRSPISQVRQWLRAIGEIDSLIGLRKKGKIPRWCQGLKLNTQISRKMVGDELQR